MAQKDSSRAQCACAFIRPRKKCGPGLKALVDPAVSKGLGKVISRGPLQPWPFGDPVKHLMILLYLLNLKTGFKNYQYPCDILEDWAHVAHVFETLCIN